MDVVNVLITEIVIFQLNILIVTRILRLIKVCGHSIVIHVISKNEKYILCSYLNYNINYTIET